MFVTNERVETVSCYDLEGLLVESWFPNSLYIMDRIRILSILTNLLTKGFTREKKKKKRSLGGFELLFVTNERVETVSC